MTGRNRFGSVRRLPSGRFQASYWHNGVRHTGPTTFKTRGQASDWLTTERAKVLTGGWVAPSSGKILFRAVAEQWLTSNPGKRPSTLERDTLALKNHILPQLGSRTTESISPVDVQNLVNTWSMSLSPRSVRREYGVLRAVMAYAVQIDIRVRTPCRSINLPEVVELKRSIPTRDELASVAANLPDQYSLMVWLGAVLGLRWGEVAGLRLRNLDVLAGTVSIDEQLTRAGTTGPPKSSASQRTMAAPRKLMEMVAEHLARAGLTAKDQDRLLFATSSGAPLDYSNFRRVWRRATAQAGVPALGFHDLRRAAATALVAESVDLKTTQRRLGHSDPRVTLSIYAQAVSENDKAAAERLAERFLVSSRTSQDLDRPSA